MPESKQIVFLDRDGTINIDSHYVTSPKDIELIPGAAKAIGDLKRAGFFTVVVTNQSAVGRGMAKVEDVDATNVELRRQLLVEDRDAHLDCILCSFDSPDNPSDERKPGTGLLKKLPQTINFLAENSWMIGDKLSDIEFGINAGLLEEKCLLVLTGHGKEQQIISKERDLNIQCFADLEKAVSIIL